MMGNRSSILRPGALAALAFGLSLAACAGNEPASVELAASTRWLDADSRLEVRDAVMGIEARLVLYAQDEPAARLAAAAAIARLHELDAVMSDWRDDSELMRLCRRAGETVHVSDDLYRVLHRARAVAAASDGAFDVTVGPLVILWRQARRESRMPDADTLAQAMSLVGYELMALDDRARTVRLEERGLQLDLGGIGKGFAADEALMTLRRHGIDRALVDLGGDLALGAPPPGRSGWRIALDYGHARVHPMAAPLVLSNAGVATSGATFQSVEIDGVRYSHIVDPRTGLGLTHHITFTVVAPDGATADALASAVSVLGRDRGRALVDLIPGGQFHSNIGVQNESHSR